MKAINGYRIKKIEDLAPNKTVLCTCDCSDNGFEIDSIENINDGYFPEQFLVHFDGTGNQWYINYDDSVVAIRITFANGKIFDCKCKTNDEQKGLRKKFEFLFKNGHWPDDEQIPEADEIMEPIF